ncbi:putative perilipin mpl1-like protein [Erysiphe neolycopersici]|uniref:Putative perilipin mpl1-like protein n=1 Tax=Erysiphe neolycopersici TaxID=212602 RepID=A0A420HU06_9PEZI|nr:putative perilipin mpl1-like protein [Erysiphe neolycopersici]
MPHFASGSDMSSQLNGESRPTSAFISHLKSYPIISDSILTITSNPYGAKSLSITTSSYERISKPLLPYLRTPLAYISPYAARADSIGNSTLSSLDKKFPVVKKPTGELIEEGKAVVFFPLRKGCEGRDYVKSVFDCEKEKFGGTGIINYGKAALATSLVVSSNALNWLNGYLAAKTDQAKELKKEKL